MSQDWRRELGDLQSVKISTVTESPMLQFVLGRRFRAATPSSKLDSRIEHDFHDEMFVFFFTFSPRIHSFSTAKHRTRNCLVNLVDLDSGSV